MPPPNLPQPFALRPVMSAHCVIRDFPLQCRRPTPLGTDTKVYRPFGCDRIKRSHPFGFISIVESEDSTLQVKEDDHVESDI